MIARIIANLTSLGFSADTITLMTTNGDTGCEERAEDPAVFDKLRQYGKYLYLVPLAEGRDKMTIYPSTTDKEMKHNLSVNVTGYYNETGSTLTTALRIVRNYGYNLVDLFNGDDNAVGLGFCTAFELENGYFEDKDQIIHSFNVKVYVVSLERHA